MESATPRRPCYRPGKDIVVPTPNTEEPTQTRYLEPELDRLQQVHTILFGGSITGHPNGIDFSNYSRPELDAGE